MEKIFKMEWPELGKNVRVKPISHNIEVYDWFLSNLPTECLQTVTVVAGYSLFMLNLPLKQSFPWKQKELICENIVDMPKGRFTFFNTVGKTANLSCKFGLVTEPMSYVTWAEVVEEDKKILVEVGEKLWSIAMGVNKEIVTVKFYQ